MSPEMASALKIVGGSVLGAVVVDIKMWASAPKQDNGSYACWDWQAAIRSWAFGLAVGIQATGFVAATS